MFNFFDGKHESSNGIELKVASHLSDSLQSPYIYKHFGNLSLKIDAEPVIKGDKVALFEDTMVSVIRKLTKLNGYTSIRDDLVGDVLEQTGVSYPTSRRTGEVIIIEDDKAYCYVPGMNCAKEI